MTYVIAEIWVNHNGKFDLAEKLIFIAIKKYSENPPVNCRVFIRPSGTEALLRILVEAENQEIVDFLSREITSKLNYEINKIAIRYWMLNHILV